MNIVFQKGDYNVSKEIAEGIIVDYTKDGKVMAIELLDVKKRMPLKSIGSIRVDIPLKAYVTAK